MKQLKHYRLDLIQKEWLSHDLPNVFALIPKQHCKLLQEAGQSKKNNKKCYKLAFLKRVASSKFTFFLRLENKAYTCNKPWYYNTCEANS